MDEEIKEVGEMATIEDEEEITIEEDYTTLEAETIIIDDDSNIQTDAEYEQAVAQKELADEAREALSAVLLSVLEKGEINDDDIAEIAAQQEIYTENVTALKILGLTTEDGKNTAGKSTTNVITSNIDYNELMKVLSEKADWLYIDEDGQIMLNGEVVPKLKVVELEAEKIKADVGEFKNLTTENFTATNATIENLKANKADIEYLNANYATIENLNATNADINNLKANKADIEYLDANYATINLLNTNIASINTALIDKANVSDLNATNANVTNLQATKANITDLNAAKGNIDTLTSNLADITTLVNGNLTSDNIQSMVITGDKFTVANGFIKNAMIDSINANKINTGTINTNNVSIQSADGSMVINGTTQQFKDKNNKVRIQIGKDAQGNFTFALFSQDGVGVLIDETGIKSGAVPNGLIVNDMVSDNANISGSKLDINSVISSINNGTTVIKGTRIQLDEQGQSLQVAFSQLKSKVETIENISIEGDLSSVIEQVTSNTTSINTMQGQISSLISNTTITKANGEVVQLKDEYNSTKDTVNSHSTKIGSLETNLNKVSTGQNKWLLEMFEKGEGIDAMSPITIKDVIGKVLIKALLVADSATSNQASYGDNYLGRATTYVYLDHDHNWETTATSDDGSTIYLNGNVVATLTSCTPIAVTLSFKQGWNKITWVYNEGINGDGWDFNPRLTTIPQIKYMNAYPMTNIDEVGNILDGNIKTVSSKQASLEQNLDGFKQTVSNTYSTKAELNNVDGKFADYSTTSAMNSAINQKADNILSTVSSTYATQSSVTDLSNNLTNNYSTTSAMNSAINQKANEITSSVSQTYATKSEFNNLNIGGRNFVINSGFKGAVPNTQIFPHWDCWGDVMVFGGQGNPNYNDINTLYLQNSTTTGGGICQDIPSTKIPKNTEITISYDIGRESNVINSYATLEFYDTDLNRVDAIDVADAVGHVVRTVTTSNTDYSTMRLAITHAGSNSSDGQYVVRISNIKIEKGNRATDWSPAPEDIDNSITVVDNKFINYSTTQQMNSAIDQKANEINLNVSTTYATKSSVTDLSNNLSNNYSTTQQMNSAIDAKADSITQSVSNTYATRTELNDVNNRFDNYSTTSDMNSAINQKANEITSSVSSAYSTKTETSNQINGLQGQINDTNNNISNNYASKSELQQTTNSITAKFSESGGYNLLRNSGFKNGFNYWSIHSYNTTQNGTVDILTNSNAWGFPDTDVNCCVIRISNQDNIEYGIRQEIATTIGKAYTVSFYYASHRMSQANMIIRYPDGNYLTNKAFNPSTKSGGNSDVNNWDIFTHTFTATHNTHILDIIVNSAQNDGNMWIAKPMICEGELPCPYSPHPSEVYDGITQIDKDGIKVYHNNIGGDNYTHMAPNGFYLRNKGEEVFRVNADGLYLKGNVEITNGSVPSSLLNGQVSDNLIGEWIRNGATNGSNANTWLNNSSPGWNNATSIVEAGHVNWDNAKATLDNNAGKWNDTSTRVTNSSAAWDNAYNRVVDWAYGAVGSRTTINGGLIQTNTITTQHLAIGDFNNYSQLIPGENIANRHGYANWIETDDHSSWANGDSRFLPFTINETINPFKQGDKVGLKFEAYAGTDMDVDIGVWFYSDNAASTYIADRTARVHLRPGWNSYSAQITIDCNEVEWARSVAIMIQKDAGNYIEVRNVLVARMINNVMIEDGAITADKIAADAITGKTIAGSIFKSGADYNPHKQNITGLQMQDDTIYSYGNKNNGMYAVTKISGGTINIGNGADGAGLNWSTHISSSDISLFKQGSSGYFYVGTTNAPGSGYSTTTTTIDTTTINIGSKDETTAFKVDYNDHCEFGNNYFTRGSLTINQLSQGSAGGAQTYLSGTTISATTIYQNGSKVTGSDIILKDNIKEYEGNALDIVNKTNIYSFNRISDPNRTEIGFIAQQVPDELIYQRGKFTAEELEGLTPEEKTALLEQAQIEANKERDIAAYDKIAEEVVPFYDLDDKQTQNQIDKIQEEANNVEYTSPVSMLHENNIIGIMWKAIQELSKKVDELSK